jgi:hypothetical protein
VHRLLLTGGLCLALGACATAPTQTLPTCNGQHRRPANPNGSVLLPTSASGALSRPAPTKPSAARAGSYAPCGDPS